MRNGRAVKHIMSGDEQEILRIKMCQVLQLPEWSEWYEVVEEAKRMRSAIDYLVFATWQIRRLWSEVGRVPPTGGGSLGR